VPYAGNNLGPEALLGIDAVMNVSLLDRLTDINLVSAGSYAYLFVAMATPQPLYRRLL
jgi:hypothetical protein